MSEGGNLHNQIGALIDQRQQSLLVIVNWIKDRTSQGEPPEIPHRELQLAVDQLYTSSFVTLPEMIVGMSEIFIAASRHYLKEGLHDNAAIINLETQHSAIRFFERLMTLQVKS